MGGRVKRSNGYNVDDFVADDRECALLSTEDDFGDNDASSSDDSVLKPKVTSKKRSQEVDKPAGNAKVASTAAYPKPKKQPKRATRQPKRSFGEAAADDELDQLIGAESDSEAARPDVSDFEAAGDVRVDVSEQSDDDKVASDDVARDKAKGGSKKLTCAPMTAEASPPSHKRTREEDDDNKAAQHVRVLQESVSPVKKKRKAEDDLWMLSGLSKRFQMRRGSRGSPVRPHKAESPGLGREADHNGPYYI